jgi:hypothetical protein
MGGRIDIGRAIDAFIFADMESIKISSGFGELSITELLPAAF